jgi:hypothetical protein
VFNATEAQFAWVIKGTLQLLARAFSLLFAGKSAGTYFDSIYAVETVWGRTGRRFKSDAMVKKESEKVLLAVP